MMFLILRKRYLQMYLYILAKARCTVFFYLN